MRHYDASRKICPQSMSADNWQKWWSFKSRLASGAPAQVSDSQGITYGTVTAGVLNVRSGAGTNYKIIGQLQRGEKVRLDEGWKLVVYIFWPTWRFCICRLY